MLTMLRGSIKGTVENDGTIPSKEILLERDTGASFENPVADEEEQDQIGDST
eukprot:SAG31_NODE_17616_length_664_cov_0.911504_1_plen_52_part_00